MDFRTIEKKWQDYWEKNQTFQTKGPDPKKPKYYVLDMFPYPSGDGLHVGHVEGYTGTDIVARFKRMKGFNVLHPMGWDAFGLPAEQFAIQKGVHPKITTEKNISRFRTQLKGLGFSYDWNREVDTTDPDYYRWTQWIFLLLYEKGLAYMSDIAVNWCEELGTVLANEEVIDGKSERGGYPVIRKPMRQWVLKITEYAERLLEDLALVDWPEPVKEMQRNWIGKSEGASIRFKISDSSDSFEVFTTRPDTLFGCTYCVLAPEHPLVNKIVSSSQKSEVEKYQKASSYKSDLERTGLAKNKTGVFTGAFADHPITGEKIPVWVADYVLIGYGTGAIMAVPAHDERDFEFANAFKIPVKAVVKSESAEESQLPFCETGIAVNSDFLNGLESSAAKKRMIDELEKRKIGTGKTTYKLRDWIFSRQRYWGEPIPILLDDQMVPTSVAVGDLPLRLPEVEKYKPTGTGESPLAAIENWVNTVDSQGRKYRRETNTMPQWAGSCWYYLRFTDPRNKNSAWDPSAEKYWMPVDLYVGGTEHAVLHLLYARFWHKVLFDCGFVSTKEPFQKLFNQGMILGSDGEKMSKSRGNVVSPEEVIERYGADTLRCFEMFLGPFEKSKPWNPNSIEGVHRFLKRVYQSFVTEEGLLVPAVQDVALTDAQAKILHQSIAKIDQDTERLQFNTAISQMMIFTNDFLHWEVKPREAAEKFILCLAPYAPHLAEEIWSLLGHKTSLSYETFPKADAKFLVEDDFELVIQVNGKIRDKMRVARGISQDDALVLARGSEKIQKELQGKELIKVVLVKDKLLSLVVK